jgi:hypothetical protein
VATQHSRSQYTLAAAALLLGFCSSAALASSGIKADCDGAIDKLPNPKLPSPSLNITVVDHGMTDTAAGIQSLPTEIAAEKIVSPTLAEEIELTEGNETASEDDDNGKPVSTPPETALRLPGVSEVDQPHFRSQMYRTDI